MCHKDWEMLEKGMPARSKADFKRVLKGVKKKLKKVKRVKKKKKKVY